MPSTGRLLSCVARERLVDRPWHSCTPTATRCGTPLQHSPVSQRACQEQAAAAAERLDRHRSRPRELGPRCGSFESRSGCCGPTPANSAGHQLTVALLACTRTGGTLTCTMPAVWLRHRAAFMVRRCHTGDGIAAAALLPRRGRALRARHPLDGALQPGRQVLWRVGVAHVPGAAQQAEGALQHAAKDGAFTALGTCGAAAAVAACAAHWHTGVAVANPQRRLQPCRGFAEPSAAPAPSHRGARCPALAAT
jgi:hypothetical protein